MADENFPCYLFPLDKPYCHLWKLGLRNSLCNKGDCYWGSYGGAVPPHSLNEFPAYVAAAGFPPLLP